MIKVENITSLYRVEETSHIERLWFSEFLIIIIVNKVVHGHLQVGMYTISLMQFLAAQPRLTVDCMPYFLMQISTNTNNQCTFIYLFILYYRFVNLGLSPGHDHEYLLFLISRTWISSAIKMTWKFIDSNKLNPSSQAQNQTIFNQKCFPIDIFIYFFMSSILTFVLSNDQYWN